MNDMSVVIIPKSDQINADDLISGPMTIIIRDVQISGGQEQPVSILFEGSDKAFRPCKSMSRVLVYGWGPDAKVYIGRSLTLYRDAEVKWGGMAVGGIRISHMSHIDSTQTMVLAVTKGSRKPYKVMPLKVEEAKVNTPTEDKAKAWAEKLVATLAASSPDEATALLAKHDKTLAKLKDDRPELHKQVMAAQPTDDDPFATDEAPAGAKFADGILTDLEKVETVIDLNALFAKAEPHLKAMDEADAETIRGAFDKAREKLGVPA